MTASEALLLNWKLAFPFCLYNLKKAADTQWHPFCLEAMLLPDRAAVPLSLMKALARKQEICSLGAHWIPLIICPLPSQAEVHAVSLILFSSPPMQVTEELLSVGLHCCNSEQNVARGLSGKWIHQKSGSEDKSHSHLAIRLNPGKVLTTSYCHLIPVCCAAVGDMSWRSQQRSQSVHMRKKTHPS